MELVLKKAATKTGGSANRRTRKCPEESRVWDAEQQRAFALFLDCKHRALSLQQEWRAFTASQDSAHSLSEKNVN